MLSHVSSSFPHLFILFWVLLSIGFASLLKADDRWPNWDEIMDHRSSLVRANVSALEGSMHVPISSLLPIIYDILSFLGRTFLMIYYVGLVHTNPSWRVLGLHACRPIKVLDWCLWLCHLSFHYSKELSTLKWRAECLTMKQFIARGPRPRLVTLTWRTRAGLSVDPSRFLAKIRAFDHGQLKWNVMDRKRTAAHRHMFRHSLTQMRMSA